MSASNISETASKIERCENPIKVSEVVQQGGLFKAVFNMCLDNIAIDKRHIFTSSKFIIDGITVIQAEIAIIKKYIDVRLHEYDYNFNLRAKNLVEFGLKTNVDFSCTELNILRKQIISGTSDFQNIYECKMYSLNGYQTLHVTINTNIVDTSGTFDALYDDTDLTDFELHGEGGNVPVHKAVLAACSPVFKRMLAGEWKEIKSGKVTIPDTSVNALQNLKMYMYKRQLPETGFEQLLLLAAYYMMPGLERRCIKKLVSKLTPENILQLCEFAVKNQMQNLLLAILERVQCGRFNVGDIRLAALGSSP